jgi:hypothetical protein
MVIRVHIDGTLPYGVGKAKFTGAQVPGGGSGVMRVQSVLNLVDLAVSAPALAYAHSESEFSMCPRCLSRALSVSCARKCPDRP